MSRKTTLAVLLIVLPLAGCSTRLDHFTRPPTMTAPGAIRNPLPPLTAERASIAPPKNVAAQEQMTSASLWRSGPQSLFGDRRARELGDILTVVIEIDEEAEIRNRTDRNRSSSDDLSVPAMLGANTLVQRILPAGASLNPALETQSSSTSNGDGLIKREEKITLRIAATVSQVLPNGHLAIVGTQEVRVNYELRELQVVGIIRPEDISRSNIITYDKIADARISYGGRGQISDLQKSRYGQQLIDIISPF